MIQKFLNDWKMQDPSEGDWLSAKIPCSLYDTLLNHGRMEDPFYRDNE